MRFHFLLAIGTAVLAVGCASIPDVTFQDADGSADAAASKDGAGPSPDGAPALNDGGTRDSGNPQTEGGASCSPGPNDVCCGTQLCKGCAASDCSSCTAMQCDQNNGDICCIRGKKLGCGPNPGC